MVKSACHSRRGHVVGNGLVTLLDLCTSGGRCQTSKRQKMLSIVHHEVHAEIPSRNMPKATCGLSSVELDHQLYDAISSICAACRSCIPRSWEPRAETSKNQSGHVDLLTPWRHQRRNPNLNSYKIITPYAWQFWASCLQGMVWGVSEDQAPKVKTSITLPP